MARIVRENNKIIISGAANSLDILAFAGCLYHVCEKRGHREIVIDFSESESLFENFMVPLICYARLYEKNGIILDIEKPKNIKLASLFHNANWSHLIAPRYYEESTYIDERHLPALVFYDSETQNNAVDRIIDVIMASVETLNRKSLAALEWSVNEITDNVLNHSQAGEGIVQASTFAGSKTVEFVVADAGLGIARTLGDKNQTRALERAIQEGVTRNSQTNAGNGLFGSYEIATHSGGSFELISGYGHLLSKGRNLSLQKKDKLYKGTIVISRIDCSQPDIISQALKFKNKIYQPAYDYIEKHYESDLNDNFIFCMRKESSSFGTRSSGKVVYNKLFPLIKEEKRIVIDFEGIFVISSSFADEVFGRIFVEVGPLNFMSKIVFINCDNIIRGLIDRAIMQRSAYNQKVI